MSMCVMGRISKVILLAFLAAYPFFAHGFLSFCFPISLVILAFTFAWPSMILYEALGIESLYLGVALGILINVLIIYYIGRYLDHNNKNTTNYRYKLLKIFGIVCAILLGFMFIDPSCWG